MNPPPAKKQRTNDFWAGGMDQFAANEADEGGDDEEEWDDMDEQVDEAELERHRQDVERRYARREPATLNQDILRGQEPRHQGMNLLDRLAQKYASNAAYDDNISVAASA